MVTPTAGTHRTLTRAPRAGDAVDTPLGAGVYVGRISRPDPEAEPRHEVTIDGRLHWLAACHVYVLGERR